VGQSGNQEPLIGQIIGGRYEVVRLIGKGGMGNIYEVRNTRLGQPFALKTLTCEAAEKANVLKRFRREADVIARIKHPNIVEVIDWETLGDGSPAMVMEYLRGEDLASRLERGPVDWPSLARIADQMLAALSIAHVHGIVHRDLKPQNVFLAKDDEGGERVKLLDFGVSKVRDTQSFVTSDEHLVGTPAYMSPEQADGRPSDVGPQSDVWSIGVILYEMAAGEPPFNAPSVPSLLYKICHDRPRPLLELRPDAPDAFVELVTATLTRESDQRIANATDLRGRLRSALHAVAGVQFAEVLPATTVPSHRMEDVLDDAPAVLTHSEAPTPSMIARRRLAPFALAVAALAAIIVVVAIVVATRDTPSRTARSSSSFGTPTLAPADAAVATELEPSLDAAIAAPATLVHVAPAALPPDLTKRRPHRVPAVEPSAAGSAGGQPEPPIVVPARKRCAKDDIECLYGDGT
jgi:serine/threonine protein kinase